MDVDLSFKDIRFLRKVRDINANPEAYERTEKGEVPASTGAIIKASNLTEGEVKYRLGGSQCRGFEDMGLTVVHEAEFDEETKTFGAKSVELTQKAIDVLTEYEEDNVFEDNSEDVPEVVKQLRGRVNQLEQESRGSDSVDVSREIRSLRGDISRLETRLDSIENDPYGAVDTDVVGFIKEAIKSSKAMVYIFKSVFGIDVERRVEDGSYPNVGAIEAERVDVYDVLSSAGYSEDDSVGDSPGGESGSEPTVVEGGPSGTGEQSELGESGVVEQTETSDNPVSD